MKKLTPPPFPPSLPPSLPSSLFHQVESKAAEVEENDTRLHEERASLRTLLEGEFNFDEELRARLGEGFDAGEVRRREGGKGGWKMHRSADMAVFAQLLTCHPSLPL